MIGDVVVAGTVFGGVGESEAMAGGDVAFEVAFDGGLAELEKFVEAESAGVV